MPTVPTSTLLVVAPDADLRRSLAFLFEAEGFAVRACACWPPEAAVGPCDMLVIDDDALPKASVKDLRDGFGLKALQSRLVLLGGRADLRAHLPDAAVVPKPLLDRILFDTVRTLLALARPSRS
ncbi:MAG: hypothetical protein ACXU8U_02925 [Asticcacaulis sp.]